MNSSQMGTPHHSPPKIARKLFNWYCNDRLKETIQGDMHERFDEDVKSVGVFRARVRYWLNVLRFINRYTLSRDSAFTMGRMGAFYMLRSYLLVAVRQLQRQKVFSAINIGGLTIGFTSCLLIAIYVLDELSYDKFHTNADRTFRISSHSQIGGNERHWSLIPSTVPPALKEQLPEVETFARISPTSKSEQLVTYGDDVYDESVGNGPYGNVFFADSSIFDVFTYTMSSGDVRASLTKPNSVVITQKVADKIFGSGQALGSILQFSNLGDYQVTGVIEEVPANSHFQFEYLLHGSFDPELSPGSFFWVRGYIVLYPDVDLKKVKSKLNSIGIAAQPSLLENGVQMDYYLQPVTDIHLTSGLEYELYPTSDIRYIYVFLAVAGFILIVATINFVNLSTAQLSKRSREVGIRKVLGAAKAHMLFQFFVQALVVSAVSGFISLALLGSTLAKFSHFLGKQLTFSMVLEYQIFGFFLLLIVFIALISGSYPALILSRLSPIAAIKENQNPGSASNLLRRILVIIQFSISVVLMVATFTVVRQLHFLKNKKLGFEPDKVITVSIDRNQASSRLSALKNEILALSGIQGASYSSGAPGKNTNVILMLPEGFDSSNSQRLDGVYADFDFIRTYGIKLLAGRDFDPARSGDSLNFILNKTAVIKFGWAVNEAVGKKLDYIPGGPQISRGGMVIGVADDFHYKSLHDEIGPLLLGIHSDNFSVLGYNHLSMRITPSNALGLLSQLDKTWRRVNGNTPFDFAFINATFEEQYVKEERLSTTITSFAVLAIVIACLGLLGLVSFTTQQRTKEIGIRKLLGASILNILRKLSGGFVTLIIIGNFIAWPLGWFLVDKWLEGFAYRVDVSFWIFLASCVSSVLIALAAIGYQTTKAATENPVNSLRYE